MKYIILYKERIVYIIKMPQIEYYSATPLGLYNKTNNEQILRII